MLLCACANAITCTVAIAVVLAMSSMPNPEPSPPQPPNNKTIDCSTGLTNLSAFLYGLPAGLLLSGAVLVCFLMFGNAIGNPRQEQNHARSLSSNTKLNRKDPLGKKHRRGPPPSADLRPLNMNQLAQEENVPDDVKEALRLAKQAELANRQLNKGRSLSKASFAQIELPLSSIQPIKSTAPKAIRSPDKSKI